MGICNTLMLLRSQGSFETVVSERLLAELHRALGHKKFAKLITPEEALSFVGYVERGGRLAIDPPSPPQICRDPSDDYLFALAVSSGATVIVSGDQDLRTVDEPPVSVLSPRAFLEALPQR